MESKQIKEWINKATIPYLIWTTSQGHWVASRMIRIKCSWIRLICHMDIRIILEILRCQTIQIQMGVVLLLIRLLGKRWINSLGIVKIRARGKEHSRQLSLVWWTTTSCLEIYPKLFILRQHHLIKRTMLHMLMKLIWMLSTKAWTVTPSRVTKANQVTMLVALKAMTMITSPVSTNRSSSSPRTQSLQVVTTSSLRWTQRTMKMRATTWAKVLSEGVSIMVLTGIFN